MFGNLDRTTGFHVDLLGPVRGDELVGTQQGAIGAVQDIGKAVAVEVDETLARLAIDGHVNQDVLIDAVIVPLVERGHLVYPGRLAGVDVAGEDTHRPLVVELSAIAVLLRDRLSTTELRAPQTGISRAVVDHMQGRVITVKTPSRSAATLPFVTRESVDAQILACGAVFRMRLVGVCCQADIFVTTGGMTLPDFLAVGQRVGRNTTACG